MKEQEPDQTVQAQLDHLAKIGRMVTNAEVCIVIVDSAEKPIQAAIASAPGPRNRNRAQQFEKAVDALVAMAAALVVKHSHGNYQLMLKTPTGLQSLGDEAAVLLAQEIRS